tara:strand:- start:366 stop:500 length:135 start_codon:yes stop_codon:yes gene_type:complete
MTTTKTLTDEIYNFTYLDENYLDSIIHKMETEEKYSELLTIKND